MLKALKNMFSKPSEPEPGLTDPDKQLLRGFAAILAGCITFPDCKDADMRDAMQTKMLSYLAEAVNAGSGEALFLVAQLTAMGVFDDFDGVSDSDGGSSGGDPGDSENEG